MYALKTRPAPLNNVIFRVTCVSIVFFVRYPVWWVKLSSVLRGYDNRYRIPFRSNNERPVVCAGVRKFSYGYTLYVYATYGAVCRDIFLCTARYDLT
jgi:hypothetical protein